MKKFTLVFLSMFMMAFLVSGQNLVLNGDLELWDDVNMPTDWTKAESITQSTDMVHGGTYSAMHTSADGTQDFQQDINGIIEGSNYRIKYYYYDNDAAARTRIWAYWMNGTDYLDANADELRPSAYSEDGDQWVEFSVDLTAPATANAFRFEVRVYKQDGNLGGNVFYDDFSLELASVNPEPTNYPTTFAAEAIGMSIDLSWIDAVGAQLPNAYLILASTNAAITAPVDGTPVENDLDFADGTGAMNVSFGDQAYMFNNLVPDTKYYFVIYPYTNGGENIDFKTDGTAPVAEETTDDVIIINAENFNDTTLGDWTAFSVLGDQVWEAADSYGIDNSPMAKASGYTVAANANNDWLISPELTIDIDNLSPVLEFWSAYNHSGPVMEVKVSTDYTGAGDPEAATWTAVTAELSGGTWTWVYSGAINLSEVVSTNTFYVAFQYTSTASQASTWEVDDILITAVPPIGLNENKVGTMVAFYPNPAQDFITFENTNEKLEVEVFNVQGAMVLKSKVADQTMDISSLKPGVYFVSLNNKTSKKLIVF
jgi:Secretion system C-terminal sorting domain/Domain of unknown function (DUF5017)